MDQLAIDEDLPPLERLRTYSNSDIGLQRCDTAPLEWFSFFRTARVRVRARLCAPLDAARLTSRAMA